MLFKGNIFFILIANDSYEEKLRSEAGGGQYPRGTIWNNRTSAEFLMISAFVLPTNTY